MKKKGNKLVVSFQSKLLLLPEFYIFLREVAAGVELLYVHGGKRA